MADVLSGQALPGGATNYLFFIISGVVLVVLVAFATIVSRWGSSACHHTLRTGITLYMYVSRIMLDGAFACDLDSSCVQDTAHLSSHSSK